MIEGWPILAFFARVGSSRTSPTLGCVGSDLHPFLRSRSTGVYLPPLLRRGLGIALAARRTAMHWLWVLLIGLVIGAVAKFVMPGKDPGGFIVTILIGIAGSLVGTWLGRTIGLYQEGQSAGFIMSVVGALLLLGIYHLIRRRQVNP